MHPHIYDAMKLSQASYDSVVHWPRGTAVTMAAVAIDAWHCRWDVCGCKHFHFCQKYCMRPQASAADWYPVLPSAASAADAFTDTSACVCGCVHVYRCVRKRTHVYTAMCWCIHVRERVHNASACVHRCVHGNSLIHTSLLHCLRRFLLLSPASGGREGEIRWLSHRCVERQVGQFSNWNLTCARCRVKQQLQRPTTERVLLADLHVELWSLFVTSGKLAGWSVYVYNTHPDFERGSYGEIFCVL